MTTETTDTPPSSQEGVVSEEEFGRRRLIAQCTKNLYDNILDIGAQIRYLDGGDIALKDWWFKFLEQLPDRVASSSILRGPLFPHLLHALVPLMEGDNETFHARVRAALPHALATGFKLDTSGLSAALPAFASMLDPDDSEMDSEYSVKEVLTDKFHEVDGDVHAMRMRRTIARLFDGAPKMIGPDGTPDPTQAPALDCMIVLRGSIPPLAGVLSTTPEGGLRLASPTEIEDPEAPAPLHPRAPKATKKVIAEQFFDYSDVVAIVVQRDVKASASSPLIS